MVQTYGDIGIDSDYTKVIQQFASLQASGQIAGGGESSPMSTLSGNNSNTTGSLSSGDLSAMIQSLLSGSISSDSLAAIGLDLSSINFLQNRDMSDDDIKDYVLSNRLDSSKLQWNDSDSTPKIHLSAAEWDMVSGIYENMLIDDGQGYIDMGLDKFFKFDENGYMLADKERAWISIDGNPVAYYHLATTKDDKGDTTVGYVPALLNGERANLIIVFDSDHPKGYLAGANFDYTGTDVDTVAKNITEIKTGDKIDFLANYYSYDGTFENDYKIGYQYTVSKQPEVYYVNVKDDNEITYKFTDIYNNSYWTPVLKSK